MGNNEELARPPNDLTDIQAAPVDDISEVPAQEGCVFKAGGLYITGTDACNLGKLVEDGSKGARWRRMKKGIRGIGELSQCHSTPRPAADSASLKTRRARALRF